MRDPHTRTYALIFAVGTALLCLVPTLLGYWGRDGYLGYQFNTDDQMVYSAWIRQAMDGRFFFDNRFTTDPQPGLTVNVYFYLLGFPARVMGIAAAAALARALLSGLFVWLAYGLICRLSTEAFVRKLALALTVFGGGVGYFVWHTFGREIVKPTLPIAGSIMNGRLPIDVWQPEAFVFPSMLTNGLFMAALCLIVVTVTAVLDARETRRSVLWGFAAFALLANIHSYDVALLGMVLVAFLAMGIARKRVTLSWVVRVLIMAAGAVVPALWIKHVLDVDAVFRARAATETFSASFEQVFFGLPLLILLALVGLWNRAGESPTAGLRRRIVLGAISVAGLVMVWLSRGHEGGYWMGMATWVAVYAAVVAALCTIASDDDSKNLLWAWALVGLVALYFPALFQRKLAMGLVVPWAMLGAIGLAYVIGRTDRGARTVVTVLGILVVSGSSLLWFNRERVLQEHNVSNTTLHPVYLSADVRRIIRYLNLRREGRTVVLAMPGIPAKADAPDTFATPFMPDLNPIVTGLAGVYTYAGHWSETPDYVRRRDRLTTFFLGSSDAATAWAFLKETQADYILAPVPEAFPEFPDRLQNALQFGTVVVDGSQFRLVKVNKKS